jgi:rare lipoprotein A
MSTRALHYIRIPRTFTLIALLGIGSSAGLGLAAPDAKAQTAQAPAPATPAPTAPAPAAGAPSGAVGDTQTGLAAYYSQRLHGRRTASGEKFNNGALTTAHQTLPFGTKVRVTRVNGGKSVVLRVNDRGPTQPNRIVDVTQAAAHRLGFMRAGLTEVKLEVVEAPRARTRRG